MHRFKLPLALLLCATAMPSAVLAAQKKPHSSPSHTQSIYPRGCEVSGFGFNQNYLVLNDKGEQTFYLIQNHTNTILELVHEETRDVFMSPTMRAKIAPHNWAAFASDVMNTHFKCLTPVGDTTTLVNCSDVIDVCQYPRVKFATSNMGNYWVSTNKAQRQIINDAAGKGILLRW